MDIVSNYDKQEIANAVNAAAKEVANRYDFKNVGAKVELAVAKGKKNYDKRHALRERQDNREADRAIAARRRGEG